MIGRPGLPSRLGCPDAARAAGEASCSNGFLTVRPACASCGLDFAFADSGDGPAFFVMSIVGLVVVGLAMWVEFAYEPPIWLHMALWIPLSCILSVGLVRPLKGLMIALQYQNHAAEGRLRP